MPYKFRCPYCFAECDDESVLFRATVGYDEKQVQEIRSNADDPERNFKLYFAKYQRSNRADHRMDGLFRYWEDKGGEAGYTSDPGWNMPYIDPKDKNFVELIRAEQTAANKVGADGFVRDKDGFVTRVIDRFGNEFAPMKRLCPHCLNPFPLADYGKYEVKFISVVGTTGAGKTVYLHQLLTRFASSMANTGYKIGTSNLSDIGEHVDPEHPLPGATDTSLMRRPLAVNLTEDKPGGKKMTLVFYDVAGEHFAQKDGMDSISSIPSGVINYIRECDAVMILIDPSQIQALSANGRALRASDIQQTISVLYHVRTNGWNGVPTAAVLTKSDRLNYNIIDCPLIYQGINTSEDVRGFHRDEFVEINNQICSFIKQNDPMVFNTVEQMDHPAYFAVSAITSGVVQKFEKFGKLYQLRPGDAEKLQALRGWVEDWRQTFKPDGMIMTQEEKVNMRRLLGEPPCQLSQQIPPEQDLTDELMRSIQTDIVGERENAGNIISFPLTLDEVVNENLVSYPAGAPNPRRVEEPLQWVLWKMGLLEPEFAAQPEPEQPRSFFARLAHQGNDPAWSAEWQSATQKARDLFYEGRENYLQPYADFRAAHNV